MAQEQSKNPPVILLPINLLEEVVSLLDKNEIGELFDAVIRYATKKEVTNFSDRTLKLIYLQIKKVNECNIEKYKEICEKNRKNINKRWQKSDLKTDETVENKEENTNRYERIPPYTPEYDRIRLIQIKKNKNKIKQNKIKKNKIKKEKNVCIKKDAGASNTHRYSFPFILSLGEEMGIEESYCRSFYEYYDEFNWLTAKGEPIKNVKMALRIWYNKDKGRTKNKINNIGKGDIKDEARRIFGDI